MNRKHSNLGRPPQKLRYFKSNERSCPYQKENVVRNIEAYFDELDSSSDTGSELTALSPIPKTRTLAEDAEVLSIMLLPVTETSDNPLCSEENPPEEFVPKKTSSPVGLATDNGDGDGEGRERASPLLFEIEGEGPEGPAIVTAPSKQAQLTRKDFDESCEDELSSPPRNFVLGKRPKSPTGGKEQCEAFCPCSSDEEFLSLQTKKVCVAQVVPPQRTKASDDLRAAAAKDDIGEPSTIPVKSKDHPHLLEKHGVNIVPSEDKTPKYGRECSVFVQKLKDTSCSKTVGVVSERNVLAGQHVSDFDMQCQPACYIRKETLPVPASPLLDDGDDDDDDEDFLILEDEYLKHRRWFSIPRRSELKGNKAGPEYEAGKLNKEGSAAATADENHSPPQTSENKQKRSKGAKGKKTNALTTVGQKREGKRKEGFDKKPSDVQATETRIADIAEQDEDVPLQLPSPCSAGNTEPDERADQKNKKSKGKQKEKCQKRSRKKPASPLKGEEGEPSSRPLTENGVALEGHEPGTRKRRQPGSHRPLNQEEQADECEHEICSSVAEKKRKPKALESPETIVSSAAERAVGQDRTQPWPTSVYQAGRKTTASKRKLGSGRLATKSKKTVTGVLGPAEDCEEGEVDVGGDDPGCSDPSPHPDQHHPPTPEKKQTKGKQRSISPKKTVNGESDRADASSTISENEAQQRGRETVGKRRRRQPGSWWLVNQDEESGNESQREVPARHKQRGKSDQPRKSKHRSGTISAQSPLQDKQQKTVPHDWLEAEEPPVPAEGSSQLHRHKKTLKKRTAKVLPKPRGTPKSSEKAFKTNVDMPTSAKPRDRSFQSIMRRNNLLGSRNVKTSLATFGSIFTPVGRKPTPNARRSASRKTVGLPITELPSRRNECGSSSHGRVRCVYGQGAGDCHDQNSNCTYTGSRASISPNFPSAKSPMMETYVKQSGRRNRTVDSEKMHQFDQLQCEVNACKGLHSGPSSMIEVDGRTVPSSQNIPHVLSEFPMCGPPLRPIALHVQDREDLVKWLKNVWSGPDGAELITPEHFQWYAYRGRAMGFCTDLLYHSFSNGKILLGSYMSKPLQVDSNAIYVYNILTSSVCVTVNGVKTDISPGGTFMVPCGHAYGMRNLTAEPAVLLYHRMVTESFESGEEETST